ncbi:MAG: DUF4374 domain-containing protein [Tannerella sp.]|jgi:hypothetical protein|nr:DUF4374 domain-containing protein [Tannerella sp.]
MFKKNLKQTVVTRLFLAGCSACAALAFTACDPDNGDKPEKEKAGAFFLSVTGESAEYILQVNNPEEGSVSIADNVKTLEMSGYTWIFNNKPSVAIGLIYRQGDPGVGLGYTVTADGALHESGQFQIASRFTSYGFFDRYALSSVGGQTPVDAQGNALTDAGGNARTDGVTFNFIDLENGFSLQEKSLTTLNMTGNGEQATFSGIVDMGNGEFLTGLVMSKPRDPNATGGASSGTITYPDSVWVAAFDAGLNLKRIYRDNRISYSSGRFRSAYYSQIGKAENGDVYVFSGSYETATTRPAGALRILRNATAFDASYYFNIEEKSGGYRFRRIWYIAENYFLLEIYNDLIPSATAAATRYGVVDMSAKTFRWVTGIPAFDKITATGQPAAYSGKMYFPVTEDGANPAIYVIDPATALAVKGLSVTGATTVNAIGRLTE